MPKSYVSKFFNITLKYAQTIGLIGILVVIFINNFSGNVYDFTVLSWIFMGLFLIGSIWTAIKFVKNAHLDYKKNDRQN